MGFLKVEPIPHKCKTPATYLQGNGSVWQCDECQKVWFQEANIWKAAHWNEDAQEWRGYWDIPVAAPKKKRAR